MSSILTPNMNLIVPTVGSESGPQYAFDVNNDLGILDQHDHSSGNGVQITPAGLNINAALTLNDNFLTSAAGMTLQSQGVTPASGTVYRAADGFLYYTDGTSGTPIQITNSSGVNSGAGSINNLTSPASASYVSAASTFVWQSGVNIAANMDAGSLLLRNLSPNSTFALTLQPPAALSSNYSITLPTLPGSTLFLTIDTSGTLGTASSISASQIATGSIIGAQLANATITGAKIAAATIASSNLVATGVGAGSYGAGLFTVNTQGQLTAASHSAISSGTYTPIVSGSSDGTATITPRLCQYIQIGNVVYFGGQVACSNTSGNQSLNFQLSLPSFINVFANGTQLAGAGVDANSFGAMAMQASAGNATAACIIIGNPQLSTGGCGFSFSGSYQVIP